MTDFWVGTSGWNYAHWRRVFYPADLPPRDWLAFYARHFLTAEINYTHYRQPSDQNWDTWRSAVPRGFRFAVKAHRYLTHLRKLNDPHNSLQRVIKGAARLHGNLGPILYQLPPFFRRNDEHVERLERFLELLPRRNQHAVEFRHSSWFGAETQELLRRHRVAFCSLDMPGLECPLVATAPFAYLRFHGTAERYSGRYTDAMLRDWAGRIRDLAGGLDDVYIYFNNDARGYAIENALTLARLLDASLPSPPQPGGPAAEGGGAGPRTGYRRRGGHTVASLGRSR